MRIDGTLKSWNDERGYGFIAPAAGGPDIFVHIKAFPDGAGRPAVGLALTFEVEIGNNGKQRARSVRYPTGYRGTPPEQRFDLPAPWTLPRILILPLFAGVCFFVANKWSLNPFALPVYLVVSIVAFLAYAFDKRAAREGSWRTSESTLLLIGLVGGWPGALLAQQFFRHKTSKTSFIVGYWITVGVNIAAFVGWHARMELFL